MSATGSGACNGALLPPLAAILALSGCKTAEPDVVVRDRVVTVNKPVLQPCVGERPEKPATIAEAIPDDQWNVMSGMQALLESAKIGLDWYRYADKLDTETSECP